MGTGKSMLTAFFHGFTFGSLPGDVSVPGLPKQLFADPKPAASKDESPIEMYVMRRPDSFVGEIHTTHEKVVEEIVLRRRASGDLVVVSDRVERASD